MGLLFKVKSVSQRKTNSARFHVNAESKKTKQMNKENKTRSNRLVVVKGKAGSGVSERVKGSIIC